MTLDGPPGHPNFVRPRTVLASSSRFGDIFDDEVPHPDHRQIGVGIGESSTAGTADERDSASLTGSAWPPTAAMMAAATSAKLALAIAEGSRRPATPRMLCGAGHQFGRLDRVQVQVVEQPGLKRDRFTRKPGLLRGQVKQERFQSLGVVPGRDGDRHHFDDRLSR